jgi:ABC-2 type transport system ATP-binding protein
MFPILQLDHIEKKYDSFLASNQVSFSVHPGSILGLLGPNGAGKTTLIRMMTRIIYPDKGKIFFKGEPLAEKHTSLIGYMPEERGLYPKMRVKDHLVYLGMLKGLSRQQASKKTEYWLQKFDIENWASRRIQELSKGMSQKVQFIGTVLHDPEFLILDEPFSGLDPINSQRIEIEIKQFKEEGKAILFSTHRMEQVEEICDAIALIHQGKNILFGDVKSLKQQFKEHKYEVKFEGILPENFHQTFQVFLQQPNRVIISSLPRQPNDVLQYFIHHQIQITGFKELLPTIQEIFVKSVQEQKTHSFP